MKTQWVFILAISIWLTGCDNSPYVHTFGETSAERVAVMTDIIKKRISLLVRYWTQSVSRNSMEMVGLGHLISHSLPNSLQRKLTSLHGNQAQERGFRTGTISLLKKLASHGGQQKSKQTSWRCIRPSLCLGEAMAGQVSPPMAKPSTYLHSRCR